MRILAGDIGGTSTRLAIYERAGTGAFERVRLERYPSAEYAGLADICRTFLGDDGSALECAGFGVAGPVHEDTCRATNLPWTIDARQLEQQLGIGRVRLVNDFHAIALGIGELEANDLAVLQDGPVSPGGPIAIAGAGTGLGEAIVLPGEAAPQVLASEGGHTDFAPRNEEEIELLRFLLRKHDRVSVERVVSGPGLHNIYEFLVQTGRAQTSERIRERLQHEDPGQVIGGSALRGDDEACVEAVEMFVAAYGAEVGNLSLTVLPTGGVYVAGGIAPRLLEPIRAGGFMRAYLHKGRMSPLLERMRVAVVLEPHIGLLGARVAALHC